MATARPIAPHCSAYQARGTVGHGNKSSALLSIRPWASRRKRCTKGAVVASSSESNVPKEKSVEGSLDALSKLLGTPTAAEEKAAAEAEAEADRQKQTANLQRRNRVDKQEALFNAQSALSVAFDLIPMEKDGLVERPARNESLDILDARLAWLKEHFKEDQEVSVEAAPEGPPVPELAATGDTFLIPFIRAPYIQQLDTMAKMNLFEPRWITLFTKMLLGSDLVSAQETTWLNGASTNTPLVLTNIEEVPLYNEGYEQFNRGEPSLLALQNPAACRLPEDPFKGSAQYGYIYEDTVSEQFAGVGTLMKLTAYDTKDRRTLQVWSRAVGAFDVLRIVQEFPYPIAEVRMLERQPDAPVQTDEALGTEQLDKEATAVRSACADLFEQALDVNLDRLVLPADLEKLITSRKRKDLEAESLDVLAGFLLRETPNAAIAYLRSGSRKERLEIMSKAATEAKKVVGLGFDYLMQQQLKSTLQRAQLGLLFLVVALLTVLTIGGQAEQVDNLL